MSRWRVVLALCVAVSACAPKPPACPQPLRVEPPTSSGARLVAEVEARARTLGVEETQAVVSGMMAEGEQRGHFVSIPEGRCLVLVARGGATLRDLDLFVFDDAGDMLAADESPSAGAATMVCPPRPRRVHVGIRAVAGAGLVGVVAIAVAPEKADVLARAFEVRGRRGEDTGRLADWPGFESKLRERRATLGGSWEDMRRVRVPLDPHAPSLLTVRLEAHRCLDVFALASEEVTSLSLELVDRDGRVLSHGRAPLGEQGVLVCSREDEEATVALRPRGTFGSAAIVVGRSARGAIAELAGRAELVSTTPTGSLERALALHHARTTNLAATARLLDATATPGIVDEHEVTVPMGCSRLDIVGGEPLGRFRAELRGPDGALLDRSEGGATAALFACQGAPRSVRLEVTSLAERGPYAVEARHGVVATPMFGHPRAAVRLLQRLEAADGPVDARTLASVSIVDLDAGGRRVAPVPFPAGCSRVTVAVDEDVPLALELVASDGVPLAFVGGTTDATLEACSEKAKAVRLTIRAEGARHALVHLGP
ncbi:MAG: hypothetical protein FJ096_18905 [Deltaproteobacteria bacterium]|nr:hypothetical protein [Deltaproteobacteria bacterium]